MSHGFGMMKQPDSCSWRNVRRLSAMLGMVPLLRHGRPRALRPGGDPAIHVFVKVMDTRVKPTAVRHGLCFMACSPSRHKHDVRDAVAPLGWRPARTQMRSVVVWPLQVAARGEARRLIVDA